MFDISKIIFLIALAQTNYKFESLYGVDILGIPTLPLSSDNQIPMRQWMHVMVKTTHIQSMQSGMHATMEKYKLYHRL